MYFWTRRTFEEARQNRNHTVEALGRTWVAKSSLSADVVRPYIEVDARDAIAKPNYDSCADTLSSDWSDVAEECVHASEKLAPPPPGSVSFRSR